MNEEESEKEFREKLSPEQYSVCRQGATEAPFSGKFLDHKEEGTYTCAGCGNPLFPSNVKYNSGSGWPSFYDAIEDSIKEITDTTHGMVRTEIVCASCNSHLGHLFPDGPKPTGMRYCTNSLSLSFKGKV